MLTIDDVEIGHFFDGETAEIVVSDGTHIVRAYQKKWNEIEGIGYWEDDGDDRLTDTLKGVRFPVEVSNGPILIHTRANVRDNWISGTLNILPASILGLGIGASYERMLGSKISLGTNFLWTHEWLYRDSYMFEINVPFRFYPGGKAFFLGVALGFYYYSLISHEMYWDRAGYHDDREEDPYQDEIYYEYDYSYGMVITPEIGWKIDVGKPGGLYVQIGTAWPFCFGVIQTKYRDREWDWETDTFYTTTTTDKYNFDFDFWATLFHGRVYFGMGYAF